MIDRLRRLQELYEPPRRNGRPEGPTNDPDSDVETELDALRQMKQLLDQRPSSSPDASTIDTILAAARGEWAPHKIPAGEVDDGPKGEFGNGPPEHPGGRADRPPRRRRRSTVLRIGSASALLAVLIAVLTIPRMDILDRVYRTGSGDVPKATQSAEEKTDHSNSEPADGYLADHAEATNSVAEQSRSRESVGARPTAVARPPASSAAERARPSAESMEYVEMASDAGLAGAEDDLLWDPRGDVMEVFEHIEMVGDGMAQGWGSPPVPLESFPEGDGGDPFYQQVREGRP